MERIKEVYVLPAILGKSEDVGRWVGGGDDEPHIISEYFHAVKVINTGSEVLVRIRLFAAFGAPEYLVVVASLRA